MTFASPAIDQRTGRNGGYPAGAITTRCFERSMPRTGSITSKRFRDKALALEVYSRQAQNVEAERRCCEIRLRAERKAGELLQQTEQAKGARGTRYQARHDAVDRLDRVKPHITEACWLWDETAIGLAVSTLIPNGSARRTNGRAGRQSGTIPDRG
jgi:hypothetical protein